ncbi:uncharacterized protein ARB_01509 [Trichophyton benhamiae CBS 112371]|uniref:Uncharacterized protein n=1 Tax=Arthroderma benhamiae (strain ATCC MYA-4681 / CBS 112371) TaxID=663331 RepID=D4AZ89_ARTBC|nr:uncharacterized protein ARB_01509 [Trichophyton benhamiae CBS 112371]EFE31609.1 hypothetical protein ARB_01509 [Trichophyton benhamiae CBS 112371]
MTIKKTDGRFSGGQKPSWELRCQQQDAGERSEAAAGDGLAAAAAEAAAAVVVVVGAVGAVGAAAAAAAGDAAGAGDAAAAVERTQAAGGRRLDSGNTAVYGEQLQAGAAGAAAGRPGSRRPTRGGRRRTRRRAAGAPGAAAGEAAAGDAVAAAAGHAAAAAEGGGRPWAAGSWLAVEARAGPASPRQAIRQASRAKGEAGGKETAAAAESGRSSQCAWRRASRVSAAAGWDLLDVDWAAGEVEVWPPGWRWTFGRLAYQQRQSIAGGRSTRDVVLLLRGSFFLSFFLAGLPVRLARPFCFCFFFFFCFCFFLLAFFFLVVVAEIRLFFSSQVKSRV